MKFGSCVFDHEPRIEWSLCDFEVGNPHERATRVMVETGFRSQSAPKSLTLHQRFTLVRLPDPYMT
jgi:hypothetical protein